MKLSTMTMLYHRPGSVHIEWTPLNKAGVVNVFSWNAVYRNEHKTSLFCLVRNKAGARVNHDKNQSSVVKKS